MTDSTIYDRVLLDTNAFLFFIDNNAALRPRAKAVLESEVELLLSTVSLWEIAIKVSTGKFTLPDAYTQFIPSQIELNDITILPAAFDHFSMVSTLPFHHKDPFDRLIIAQGLVEKLSVVTSDEVFDLYGIDRIW